MKVLERRIYMKAREKKATQSASPSLLTGWARQGVQSFVSAQKILMIWRLKRTLC